MIRKSIVVLSGCAAVLLGVGLMTADDKNQLPDPAKDPRRAADLLAIRKMSQEYIKTFEKGDAKSLAAFWTPEGEFIASDGTVTRGRAALEKGYAELFTQKEARKVDMEVSKIRLPSTDTAVVEAIVRRKNADGEVIASSWSNILLVREGGQWKIALVREINREASHDMTVNDLAWLIGTWVAAGKDRQVITTYEWDDGKAFIRGKFTVKEGGKVVESGTQVIGKDPSQGVIRSWLFQSDGGFGGGTWARDGKEWTVDAVGVLPDGREMTATNIYVRLGPDAWTWQGVNRTIGGESLPDTAPIKVERQKAPK